jgi:hypothetical protein
MDLSDIPSDLQDDMTQNHITLGAVSVLYIRRLEEKREKPAVGKLKTTVGSQLHIHQSNHEQFVGTL